MNVRKVHVGSHNRSPMKKKKKPDMEKPNYVHIPIDPLHVDRSVNLIYTSAMLAHSFYGNIRDEKRYVANCFTQCIWYRDFFSETFSTRNRNVTLGLKCMAIYNFSALQFHDRHSDCQCV